MTNRDDARAQLGDLLKEFMALAQSGALQRQSEATARAWIERVLVIFGWNPSDPSQVIQEYRIHGRAARKLLREGISHERPDYALVVKGAPLLYLGARRFSVDIERHEATAFQVRSYGWSAGMRVSYAMDVEEFAVWDCRFKPKASQDADVARVIYLRHDAYLDNFDVLWDYLSREAIEGGSLERLHPIDQAPKGSRALDEDFEEYLSNSRRELARTIVRYGKLRDPVTLSAAAQRILDRIVFLRICEEQGMEEFGTLSSFANDPDGFWDLFMRAHEKRYRTVYDGILFPVNPDEDPTGVEALLRDWWLKGNVFKEIIRGLYHPQPYRFDAVPLELIGGIYERFLGKRLRVVGAGIEDEFRPEYQRTKGAVYTPPWIVRRIVDRTLGRLVEGKSPDELLALRVLDPSCGSGGFLLVVFEYLEQAILRWFAAHPDDPARARHVTGEGQLARLVAPVVRAIIERCLYGVDIDAEAVEVARMSLALRLLDRTARDESDEPRDLLKGIGRNIRHGNSLVDPAKVALSFDAEEAASLMPFDWRSPRTGFGDVMKAGGFDAVVGNPPYIEVKRYREWMPAMYRFLKESGVYETAAEGKTDIAVPFIEGSTRLLKEGGRLGFIVQNRFFKTEYGRLVRRWLLRGKWLEEVEDFRDAQVFPKRTTYTAIVVLQKDRESFTYRTFADLAGAVAGIASVTATVKVADVDEGVWSFDQPELMALHRVLAKRCGTIATHPSLSISVGLQTLYGRFYQIRATEVGRRFVTGVNGVGEEVELERASLRPLCRNRGFYPFRADNSDAWVIFPYVVERGASRDIEWPEFKERFPSTAKYLDRKKRDLKKAVQVPDGADRWHLYTRPQNLVSQASPKILFPMTIQDTLAAVDAKGDVYQDNVNVNSLAMNRGDIDLRAVAAVFNSTVFSALARLKAGMNDSGWRKFNRQFADLAPLPLGRLSEALLVVPLVALARRIEQLQGMWIEAEGEGARSGLEAMLRSLWEDLDRRVEDLYELTAEEREVIARHPRVVDRVDLLARQTSAGDGGDDEGEE